jgi:hypothetical protein
MRDTLAAPPNVAKARSPAANPNTEAIAVDHDIDEVRIVE